MLYRLFYIFFIAIVLLQPASAAVSELFVTPKNPVAGDTITISGTASPDERVNMVISFEKKVSPSNDRIYLHTMDGVEVPSGPNTFTVTAKDVMNLNVMLKLSMWYIQSTDATGGTATISHSNLKSGLYDIKIYGESTTETPLVTLDITAARTIDVDASGNFVHRYSTNSLPVGDFQLNVGGLTRTITLLAPGSDESSSFGGGKSDEDFENILLSETQREYIVKDLNVSYNFHLNGNIVRYINFTGLTNSGTIVSKVEILDHTSSLVDSAPPDIIYKNLNIWIGNPGWANPKNIECPTIEFFIEKLWIIKNNIDESTIRLNIYNERVWSSLETEKIYEDEDYLYLKAQTSEFSSFAITGKAQQHKIVQPTATAYIEQDFIPQITELPETVPMQSTGKITGFEIRTGVLGLLIVIFILLKKY